MKCYFSILRQHPIFRGMADSDIEFALDYFSAWVQSYKKGDFMHLMGDELTHFGLMLEGDMHVFTDDMDGRQMMMASNSAGDSFGESLCYLKVKEAPVYMCAASDCTVMWLSADNLHGLSSSERENDLKDRFISTLAARALSMNSRIQILSKHTLREKLMTFFTDYVRRFGNAEFTIPFDRSGMAIYLGTDRSALSRELSAMKKDGIIEYNKNRFKVLKKHSDI